jgi:hypothetical protein
MPLVCLLGGEVPPQPILDRKESHKMMIKNLKTPFTSSASFARIAC